MKYYAETEFLPSRKPQEETLRLPPIAPLDVVVVGIVNAVDMMGKSLLRNINGVTQVWNMKKTSRSRSLALASILCGFSAFGQNLLTNGSFELPGTNGTILGYAYFPGGSAAIPGWTTLFDGVEYYDPSQSFDGYRQLYLGVAQNGSYLVDLAPLELAAGGIEQSVATVVGQAYEVSFYMGTLAYYGRMGTATLTASVANTTNSFGVTNYNPFVLWSGKNFSFTAQSTNTTLTFKTTDNPKYHFVHIDNVAVIPQRGSNEVTLAIGLYPGIQINGRAGRSYVVEYTETLTATNWQQLLYVTLPTSSYMVFDTSSPGIANRFYRAIELP